MLQAPITVIRSLAPLLLLVVAPLQAQTVDDLLVERGSLVFRADPAGTTVKGVYGADGSGQEELGASFRIPELGAQHLPSLASAEDRFGLLAEEGQPPGLVLGSTRARFSLDERVLPLQLSYGVLDRLTVGVTVPFVRKQVQPLVRLVPDGANVGRNPAAGGGNAVSGFLDDADGSLTLLQSEVDETCSILGEGSPECQDGLSLVDDTDAFLDGLSGAYDEEAVFPLDDSTLGAGISSRWSALTARFADWDTAPPESAVPLPTSPLDQAAFESLYLTPAWGSTGFPLDSGTPILALGDVEAHVAVGLLRPADLTSSGPSASREGLQLVATAVGTVRFATGGADSLHVIAPLHPARGVSGFGGRLVTDLLLPGRFAVSGTLEGGWNGSVETAVLAPDPANLFRAGFTRSELRWSPGSHIRASVTPRFRLGPGLSVGAGWHLLRRAADEYEPLTGDSGPPDTPALPVPMDDYTQHRLGLEVRYAAMRPPLASEVWFPFELMVRVSRTVSGTEGAPVETKAEAMVRFRLWDQ